MPDSFTGVPGMGSPQNEGPKGFLEILFGKNPNKGKVCRRAKLESSARRVPAPRDITRPDSAERDRPERVT